MKIAFFGECMVELSGSPLQRTFGGDTLNTAVYLSRLGGQQLDVSYVTAMGTDNLSQEIIQQWQSEHLDTRLVLRLENKMPGLYMVETDESGERSFHYWRSDSAAKAYFQYGKSPLGSAITNGELDAIYLSGISLAILSEQDRDILFELLKKFKNLGGKVIFDNNYRPQLWTQAQARASYFRILSLTDIALLTEDDEYAVFGKTDISEIVSRAQTQGVREVVIKRGKAPCQISVAEQVHTVSATQVSKVVDTCAAGDSFAAGYLAKRLTGASPTGSAKAGHLLAGTVIQYPGAIIPLDKMPNLNQNIQTAADAAVPLS